MTEQEAEAWLAEELHVPRGTWDRLKLFADLLVAATARQNLISASSTGDLWGRHVVDSAQLLLHAPASATSWVDLGSGAGLPGLVIALLWDGQVKMVESRRLRVAFLGEAIETLRLSNAEVVPTNVQNAILPVQDVISARAFARLDRTFGLGSRFAGPATRWILPKGQSAQVELEAVESSWQGEFRRVGSVTDAAAGIILADGVPRRKKRA